MGKIRNVSDNDRQHFFEGHISSVSHLKNHTQGKRKTYNVSDLLVLSLVGEIVYLYSWEKVLFYISV